MNYADMFRERGARYEEAMRIWPEARRDDFLVPLCWLEPRAGDQIIDVPAGGGYLRRYLPDGCAWSGHEPCASFLDDASATDMKLLPLPWSEGFADAAISIAGVHHVTDKLALFRDIHRVLKPGGKFLLADVPDGSPVAHFLDKFVGRYNSTGHDGHYLDEQSAQLLESAGFHNVCLQREPYCWWFPDRLAMGGFCRLLFDMREISDAAVADEIEKRLGVVSRDGQVGMNWELLVILGSKTV